MRFTGDYHTHTVNSHGKGTVEDNIYAALNRGLKEIAITDHGLNHMFFPIKRNKLEKISNEVRLLNKSFNDIKIYMGVEANLISADGEIDIKSHEYRFFDLILCGFHKCVFFKGGSYFFKIAAPAFAAKAFKPSSKQIALNTEMYIKAIENNPIDIITHLNHDISVDVLKIAETAAKYGTYLEINSKTITFDDKILVNELLSTNVEFIVDSDAHKPSDVGNFQNAEELIAKYEIPLNRIANSIEGKINFRSKNNGAGK